MSSAPGPSTPSAPQSRAARRQGFLARAFDDPSGAKYQNRAARRRVSLLQGALSLLLVAVPQLAARWIGVDSAMPRWAVPASVLVLLVPWVFVTGMLNMSVFGIFELRSHQLDEAERQQRDDAYRSAYRAIIGVSVVAMGILAADAALALPVISVYLMVIILLPVHIAAWRMTDS